MCFWLYTVYMNKIGGVTIRKVRSESSGKISGKRRGEREDRSSNELGFIGTGIITTSVVTGFCESGMENLQIVVSPRNKERAQMLHEKYPEIVSIAADNQEVVDRSDWVFAALLPKAAEEILKPLHIGPEKKFINLVATLSLKRIEEMFGPREILADVVPLTFAANRFGPVVIYPDIPEVVDLMSHVGKPVPVDTPRQIAILRSTTGLMSAYYMLLTVIVQWCKKNRAG